MPQTNRTVGGVLGGLVGLVALSAVAGVLVTATVTPALAVTGAATKQAIDLFDDLPSYLTVNAPMGTVDIYVPAGEDGKFKKLTTFYDQNREPLTFDELPTVAIDAILSSEDKLFYEHAGVNLGATIKAVYDNLRGTSSRGASTISQQFVKNVQIQQCEQEVIPPTNTSNTEAMAAYDEELRQCWREATESEGTEGIQRKLQEMRYALQIEKDYSKDEILLGYLNIANFGGGAYGIQAASKYYFGKPAKELTIAEAATLAGIVQEPSRFRIDMTEGSRTLSDGTKVNGVEDGYALSRDRRDYVIRRMYADGKITQEQRDEALDSPIVPNVQRPKTGCTTAGTSGYFCRYVMAELQDNPALGETAEERRKTIRHGGFDVYTSLNPEVQKAGVKVMAERAPVSRDYMLFGAAAVTLENDTGRVLGMVQNTTFNETGNADKFSGETSLVYAAERNRGGSRGFPVGSTYKLFTLIDWLEHGRSINEVLNGRDQLFRSFTCNGVQQSNSTQIGNYAGGGGVVGTVSRFTQSSTNTGYLAMATQLDVCEINAVAGRMGVKYGTLHPVTSLVVGDKETPNAGALYDVLGSKNIAPIDMAAAYATVANGGTYCKPYAIDRIASRDGEDIYTAEPECHRVLSPEVAATAAYALRGVMTSGTGTRANTGDGVPLIGKTGTHQGIQTMMITSSTKTTTATWAGNVEAFEVSEGKFRDVSMRNRSYNGVGLQDIRYPITRAIQRAANAEYGGGRFPSPDRHLTRQVLTDLPDVIGMSIKEATELLEDAGFSVKEGSPVDSDQPEGVVGAQDPGAGKVPGGTLVTISPSNGQGASIPNVQGSDPGSAIGQLHSHGFGNVSIGSCTVDEDMDPGSPGQVTGTRPGAGEVVNRNANVRVDYRAPSC